MAGPNLVNKGALPKRWIGNIRPQNGVRLTSASLQPLLLVGVIPLVVHLGDLRFRVWLGVIKGLSVPAILGTSLIDRFAEEILPQERLIVPHNSRPIAILSAFSYEEASSTTVDK